MTPATGLDAGLIVLDGGLATELERRGLDISGTLWSARVLQSAPGAIEQLHYDYFAAGARCAISASYQASYEGFAAQGIGADEATTLLRRSVELACAARTRYREDHPADRRALYVAASVGPYGAISHDGAEYRGDYALSVGQLTAFHARRFGVLADTGADVLACETLPALGEALALAALLAGHPRSIAWMSFTSPDGIHTSRGEPLAECARRLDPLPNLVAIGVNCVRPEIVGEAIRSLRAGTDKAIVVYPNSGEHWNGERRAWRGERDGGSLAAFAPQWVAAGARMIGGCCRVGPGEIAALAEALSRIEPAPGGTSARD